MKKMLAASLATLVGVTGVSVTAEPLDTTKVGAKSEWVLHIDADAMRKSAMATAMNEIFAGEEWGGKESGVDYKFDASKDLNSVTMFGHGNGDDDGAMIVRGNFDEDHLLGLLKLMKGYKTIDTDAGTVHAWPNEKNGGKTLSYGAIAADNVLVFAEDQKWVVAGLQALTGKDGGLSSADLKGLLAKAPKNAFITGAADMRGWEDAAANAKMMKNTKLGSMSIAEVGDDMQMQISLTADNAEMAKQVHAMAQGMLAFAALNEEQAPELALLAFASKVTVDGSDVNMQLRYPLDEIIDMIAEGALKKLEGAGKKR